MAAPTFGAAGTQFQGSPGTTVSVDVPDGVVADSIIVITAFVDTPTATITALPAGFANAADSPVAGGSNRLYVFWKRATGSESTAGTYDYTTSASVYNNVQAIRYDGAITSGDPWDVTASAIDNTSGTVTPAVSDTTTKADTLLVFAGTDWAGGTWTPPASFTERRDTGDGVCTVADLAQASPGSTGSISATCTGSDRRIGWLGALRSPDAAVESGAYTPRVLPGWVNPDGRVHLPSQRFDNNGGAAPSTSAPAGSAEATGVAQQASAAVGANAGATSATGSAFQATVSIKPGAGAASADGSAPQPTVSVSGSVNAPAGLASATGVANQATVALGVNAGAASATGAALVSAAQIRSQASQAAGAGSAPQPVAAIRVNAGVASASGTAGQATVTTSGSTNAPAGIASSTGAAFQPAVALRVFAGVASATGSAPPVLSGAGPLAGLAAVAGTTPGPVARLTITAGAAAAAGQAPPVAVTLPPPLVTPPERTTTAKPDGRSSIGTETRSSQTPGEDRTGRSRETRGVTTTDIGRTF